MFSCCAAPSTSTRCQAESTSKSNYCLIVPPLLCSAIYKYALDHLPKSQAGELYRRFVQFEKQQGDREGIEVGGPAIACFLPLCLGVKRAALGCAGRRQVLQARCAALLRPQLFCLPAHGIHACTACLNQQWLAGSHLPQEVIVSERRFKYEEEVRSCCCYGFILCF